MFEAVREWFFNLGPRYGVNPVIFGAIYVGAIPLHFACIAWLIRNLRRKKPITLPLLLASFFFISAYLYVIVAGKNIPAWVCFFIAGMAALGGYSVFRKVRRALGAR